MNAKIKKLLKSARESTGYYPSHKWEVAMLYNERNPNGPFRPENEEEKGLAWGGDMEGFNGNDKRIKVGTYLEFWIYERNGDCELVDNVYVWIDSDASARVQVCGTVVKTVVIDEEAVR